MHSSYPPLLPFHPPPPIHASLYERSKLRNYYFSLSSFFILFHQFLIKLCSLRNLNISIFLLYIYSNYNLVFMMYFPIFFFLLFFSIINRRLLRISLSSSSSGWKRVCVCVFVGFMRFFYSILSLNKNISVSFFILFISFFFHSLRSFVFRLKCYKKKKK